MKIASVPVVALLTVLAGVLAFLAMDPMQQDGSSALLTTPEEELASDPALLADRGPSAATAREERAGDPLQLESGAGLDPLTTAVAEAGLLLRFVDPSGLPVAGLELAHARLVTGAAARSGSDGRVQLRRRGPHLR